ncbi:double zinc ribbon domain-containing protein [Sedimentisphaera salicampi]|uniref:DNA utilization protein GntX n=1 Tax=Sedimentisphaera salicampi TaxID=1941349 RepID=A0A1W6LNL4_9BACT|nr:double zinc ribbon domain-containing protein [Sedimentisphaera salicampi]ARN57369.1 DNA utilization protein GntX [Sedimentisphaera salicampi]
MRILAEQICDNLIHTANAVLWPSRCLACGELTAAGQPLCGDCWDGLKDACSDCACPRCGAVVSEEAAKNDMCGFCINKKLHINGFARAGRYESTLRNLVLMLKRSENAALIKLVRILAVSSFQNRFASERIDFVCPVPLHWTRRWARGFNQAGILAAGLKSIGIPSRTVLKRTRQTRPQPVMESYSKRMRNVRGAFALKRFADVQGKSILLADDVRTSGATINECARVLKEAGAEKAFALTLTVPAGQI